MKKTEWLILIATAAYSYLFYEQSAGINFFLFSILLTGLCISRDMSLIRQPAWFSAAAGTVISGFAIFRFGTLLPVYANLASVLLLAAFSYNSRTSLFTGLFNSLYSLVLCIPSAVHNFQVFGKSDDTNASARLKKALLFSMAIVVALVFFLLYRASNPLFEKITDEINLDFISWGWIFFTLFGFALMCAFFYHTVIKKFTAADEQSPDQLTYISEEEHQHTYIAGQISLANELFTGRVLLALLNLVLLSANCVDIYYLYILHQLPNGLTQAQFLHDGTNSLIFSIVLAIGILLFYFRGRLNFVENNRLLRIMAYAWIAQNIFLVVTTAQRNYFYISQYGLTHKRIGVYIFLSLCIIGLVSTFIKVFRIKSNWFMFRKNTWVWYVTLVLASLVNWDDIIARYNVRLGAELNTEIDFPFMLELSYTSYPALFEYYTSKGHIDSDSTWRALNANYTILKANDSKADWQSYCWMKKNVISEVEAIKGNAKK